MSEPKKPQTLMDLVAALPNRIFRRDALLVLVMLGAGGVGAVWAQSKADERIQKVVDGGVGPVDRKVEELREQVKEDVGDLRAEVAELKRQAQAKEERDAARFDTLYNTILSRQPQPNAAELAVPSNGHGAKDGGR